MLIACFMLRRLLHKSNSSFPSTLTQPNESDCTLAFLRYFTYPTSLRLLRFSMLRWNTARGDSPKVFLQSANALHMDANSSFCCRHKTRSGSTAFARLAL